MTTLPERQPQVARQLEAVGVDRHRLDRGREPRRSGPEVLHAPPATLSTIGAFGSGEELSEVEKHRRSQVVLSGRDLAARAGGRLSEPSKLLPTLGPGRIPLLETRQAIEHAVQLAPIDLAGDVGPRHAEEHVLASELVGADEAEEAVDLAIEALAKQPIALRSRGRSARRAAHRDPAPSGWTRPS